MTESPVTKQYTPQWSGFHHIALVTPDLDATVQFYTTVLGMRLTSSIAPANDLHGRHVGLMANTQMPGFLHFFEYKDAQIFAPPDMKTMYWLPGALHHISIILPDAEAGMTLHDHLHAHGIETTEIMDQGDIWNMLFKDNSGILLEAAWGKVS